MLLASYSIDLPNNVYRTLTQIDFSKRMKDGQFDVESGLRKNSQDQEEIYDFEKIRALYTPN